MANIDSAKKNIRIIDRRTAVNKSRKSKIRTAFRKVLDSIKEADIKSSRENFVLFESEIMKGVSKGLYKKNTAARKLRGLAKKIRSVEGE